MLQTFHVIFVIDNSGSMTLTDRQPLTEGPAAVRIRLVANNRLGAVYSALYNFWSARHAAVAAEQRTLGSQRRIDTVYSAIHGLNLWSSRNAGATRGQEPAFIRRDSYSVILFDDWATTALVNDVTSSPDQLLDIMLRRFTGGGTDFVEGIREAEDVMVKNWSTERTPIVIFLSDGQSSIPDERVRNLCLTATRLGKPLSFHSVSFGPDCSVPVLRRMAEVALEVQESVCGNPELPAAVSGPPSSFTSALDTVRLTETFLGIADSMRKPRGSLVH